MSFQFSLEILLKHKIREEEELQKEFSQAYKEEAEAKKRLDDMNTSIGDTREKEFQLISLGQESRAWLEEMNGFIKGQETKANRQREVIQQREQQTKNCREYWLEAIKERKKIESLKEKKIQEYRRNKKKKEIKELDELTTMKYGGSAK